MILHSGSDTLTIRNAELRNSDFIDQRIIVKQTMSGKLRTYRRGDPLKRHRYSFVVISESIGTIGCHTKEEKMAAIASFIVNHLAQMVTITDHNGIVYDCLFVKDTYEIVNSTSSYITFALEAEEIV